MRVFPLLDLQVAEFANQKARPGAGLRVRFCAVADASPNTPPTSTSCDLREPRARHRALGRRAR